MVLKVSERAIQKAFVKYIQLKYPTFYQSLIKIDNEGVRSAIGHAEAKRMGLHRGASDIFIAMPSGSYNGLFIEIKPDNYKVTKSNATHHEEQMLFINKMINNGYMAAMCIGLDSCIAFIDAYVNLKKV